MKLVFEYNWSVPHEASGTETIPFEYSSIEDFQFMVLELIEAHKNECIREYGEKDGSVWYKNGYIDICGYDVKVEELEDTLYSSVYTLENWFEKK